MDFYGHGMTGWGYPLMWFGMATFWVVLIGAVLLLVRRTRDDKNQPTNGLSADEVLAHRFARGDIDEQEYASRQAALHAHTH